MDKIFYTLTADDILRTKKNKHRNKQVDRAF